MLKNPYDCAPPAIELIYIVENHNTLITIIVRECLLLPTDTDVNTETLVAYVRFFKHPNRTSPALEAFHPYVFSPDLIDLDTKSDIFYREPKTSTFSTRALI